MKYEDAIKTSFDILNLAKNVNIENNIIKQIDIQYNARFYNVCNLIIIFFNCTGGSDYAAIKNCGYMVKALIKLLGYEHEECLYLSSVHDKPCRIIVKDGMCIGVGHFMLNKFILFDDLVKIDE